MASKLILYIAMSSDGFIAGENDSLDFLSTYQVEGEDYGYYSFIRSIETVIVGRRTYETVIGMGYPYHEDKKVYVITSSSKDSDNEKLIYFNGDVKNMVKELKISQTGHIYCDGGALLVKSLLEENLIDEMVLSIIPVQLNNGTLLFEEGIIPDDFELKKKTVYPTGLIQFCYVLKQQ